MASARQGRTDGARSYLVGLALASALTALPFALVADKLLPVAGIHLAIAGAAVAQIAVHLRCFLHLRLKQSSYDRLIVLALAAILIVLMVGGSLWIMVDLNARMTGV